MISKEGFVIDQRTNNPNQNFYQQILNRSSEPIQNFNDEQQTHIEIY